MAVQVDMKQLKCALSEVLAERDGAGIQPIVTPPLAEQWSHSDTGVPTSGCY